jgi:hypothetical protein
MSGVILDIIDAPMVIEALSHTARLCYEGILDLYTRHVQGKYSLPFLSAGRQQKGLLN